MPMLSAKPGPMTASPTPRKNRAVIKPAKFFVAASVSGLAFGVFFLILLLAYYKYENARRDRLYGPPEAYTESEEFAQGLSNKTDTEIESFRYIM